MKAYSTPSMPESILEGLEDLVSEIDLCAEYVRAVGDCAEAVSSIPSGSGLLRLLSNLSEQ